MMIIVTIGVNLSIRNFHEVQCIFLILTGVGYVGFLTGVKGYQS